MSLSPDPALPHVPASIPADPPAPAPPPPSPVKWQSRLLTACFAIFAFEVGLFLVIFPWQDSWTLNYFQDAIPALESLWDESAFRGAITGLGFINIYIGILQGIRIFRPR